MFKTIQTAIIFGALMAGASSAHANTSFDELGTLSFATDLELDFGEDDTQVTVTPSLEFTSNTGIYVGVDLSNEDDPVDDYSYSAYIGFAHEFGQLNYDIFYGQYFLDETGSDGEELILTVGYPVVGDISMATSVISDLDGSESIEQSFAYELEQYEISGTFEYAIDGSNSWDLGVSTPLTDELSLDARYHDSEDNSATMALTASYAIDIFGG